VLSQGGRGLRGCFQTRTGRSLISRLLKQMLFDPGGTSRYKLVEDGFITSMDINEGRRPSANKPSDDAEKERPGSSSPVAEFGT